MLVRLAVFTLMCALFACELPSNGPVPTPPRPETVYLPGDVLYVALDEVGKPTGEIQAKVQLDGDETPEWWDRVTKVRAYPVTGDDRTFNSGFSFRGGKLQLNFGLAGANVTRIGERFPDDTEEEAEVSGRAAVRRLPFDSFQSAFEKVKGQSFHRYLPNRVPLRSDQRAYYVEQVIYTNAYYASSRIAGGLDASTTAFGRDRPLHLGAKAGGVSFAYFLSADATGVDSRGWKYDDPARVATVLNEWVTVAAVLQELDVGEVPALLNATFWPNAEVVATAERHGDFRDSHATPHSLELGQNSFEGGPNMEYAGQTACWAISKVTSPSAEATVERLRWSVTVESRFGGMCGRNGSNKGGHGGTAPRVEVRFFAPAGWSLVAGGVANGSHGAPDPRPSCKLRVQGPGFDPDTGYLVPVGFGESRGETGTQVLEGGEYTVDFSCPKVEQGCYGDKNGVRREGTTSFTVDLLVQAPSG